LIRSFVAVGAVCVSVGIGSVEIIAPPAKVCEGYGLPRRSEH
jgi:hypothetical protein